MAPTRKTPKPNAPSGGGQRLPATLRETSGAGFEFEDLIAAWQLVTALSGEQMPGVGGVGTQLQAQVSTLGWRFDDLLLTGEANGEPRRLAISAKGNQQVTASGLPSSFVTQAWEQWRDQQGPFNRASDGLALVSLGTLPKFQATWREVKNACSGPDVALAMSRIGSNAKQAGVFRSVQDPGGDASDEETIELIRRLHILPVDLQFVHSDTKNQSIAQCRRLLESGDVSEAEALWEELITVAADVRLRTGTITVPVLWSRLRVQFGLLQHPDFAGDWETLSKITSDQKARIETELFSGYAFPRTAKKASFRSAIEENEVTVVFGESGCGKSALVKSVLDVDFSSWNQVWFGPEELKTALSAARQGDLPLRHELSRVLNATVKARNALVIDSAERIEATEFQVIGELLKSILPAVAQPEAAWRVVVVTQTQGWVDAEETMPAGRRAAFVELERIKGSDAKLALLSSPTLGWLAAHDDTVAALTNLRTLGWVIKAGAALGSNASGLASHTAIADRLWKYWTQGRADVQALMMRLAQREASFERSFALTDLDPADTATFTQSPSELPLRLNEQTNRVEFEHDLAADWARFQFLKQVWRDTLQWAALAENPLWTNALRMLGQFLLRESAETGPAWDIAFDAAAAAKNELAGDILLDALCLDPEAERFLTDRLELLLANDAKVFNRLLLRFHHIATVPIGGPLATDPALGLYIEERYRSIVFGRWPPLLRFLVAQRERLRGLVSSALARVIQTWLTKTQRELSKGALMPFRREMAEIALAMARTVQVQKGRGVMYMTGEYSLYTAPLAGPADLPEEVGNWALELAGRRKVDADVERRIAAVGRENAMAHAKRLETDPEYRERQEKLRRMPPSISQFRERLPPWPLGARGEVDKDFRTACFKENGLQPLMRERPELAAEILLALIIEDQPEREEYRSDRFDEELGLDYPKDAYPTAFWKSPFSAFLQVAPEVALDALIALVNFSTERWCAEAMKGREGPPPVVTLQFEDGSERAFPGWRQVFGWPQTNSLGNGNLFCALDALERWLTVQLDAGEDITAIVERLLREGNSAALVSVLLNVAKYRPPLLTGALAPLLTFPNLFYWDSVRVERIAHDFVNFVGLNWLQGGQAMFDLARNWTLAPHRRKRFLDVVVELLLAEDDVARRLKALVSTWTLPEDPKQALKFKLLFAALDSANYRPTADPETGAEATKLVWPDDLSLEVQSWQSEEAQPLTYLFIPYRCEQRLQSGQTLTDEEAVYLYGLIETCDADTEDDEAKKSTCRLAAAATLIVLGEKWLAKTPEAQTHSLTVVRAAISGIPSTSGEIRNQHMGSIHNELTFAAHAVSHLWLAGDVGREWEADVLRLLTSGDTRALGVIVGIGYANRDQLGPAWWRLLQAGVLWSGLILLTRHHGDDEVADRAWSRWLARLRRFPLRNKNANLDSLDFKRVAAGCGRLEFYRRMRLYTSGERTWLGKPQRRPGGALDGHVLEAVFGWLMYGAGTGDRSSDTRLALRIWDYDALRAKARAKRDRSGEYDLPTQHILPKIAALSLAAPENEDQAVWEPVLTHGPAAHYALEDFIRGLYLRLGDSDDTAAFERVWRAVAEYGLAADWSKPGLWFYGERLICDLLGFGNEDSLARLPPGGALRMKDVYERWAPSHLGRDEECVTRFSRFLTTTFGGPLRLDGLRWTAAVLKANHPASHWYRESTGNALVELATAALASDADALSKDAEARQALVEVAAVLAAKNIPGALALQERIRRLGC